MTRVSLSEDLSASAIFKDEGEDGTYEFHSASELGAPDRILIPSGHVFVFASDYEVIRDFRHCNTNGESVWASRLFLLS